MEIGAFTRQFDLPLLLVQLFFLFFLGLVYYLRREDKREGYPLVSDRADRTGGRVEVVGFPPMPPPKEFRQPHGRPTVFAPREEKLPPIEATNLRNGLGMPIEPIGDPLTSGTGAASWLPKIDEPDLSWDGAPTFQPLRAAEGFHVMKGDPDPRGFVVLGKDGERAGTVVDIWVDKGEHHARFLEVALDGPVAGSRDPRADREQRDAPRREVTGISVHDEVVATERAVIEVRIVDVVTAPVSEPDYGDRTHYAEASRVAAPDGQVLLPAEFASVNGRRGIVRTAAITASQFANIPGRKADTILTAREEQRIRGYFGGGLFWNSPATMGPLL